MKQNIIVIDCETGGLKEKEHAITEIALKVVDGVNLKTQHEWQTYIKPYAGLKIDPIVLKKTQITMDQINNGMHYKDAIKHLHGIIKDYTLKGGKGAVKPVFLGHNIGFDERFLGHLLMLDKIWLYDLIDNPSFCTMKLMKQRDRKRPKSENVTAFNLTACCERVGIKLKSAHGAGADINATLELFTVLMDDMAGGAVQTTGRGAQTERGRNFFEM